MSKEDQKIIAVERDILFGKDTFEGFRPQNEIDYESRILDNLKVMRRGDIEEDPSHKQPIGYVIIANPELKKVFAYQRSSKKDEHDEHRMLGNWSCGFGGHIEPIDEVSNPIREGMIREATQEETTIYGSIEQPKLLGYINDDSNSVGQVHFGLLYVIDTDAKKVKPKDSEIARIESKTINELEEICSSPNYKVENWSQIALRPLKEYFN